MVERRPTLSDDINIEKEVKEKFAKNIRFAQNSVDYKRNKVLTGKKYSVDAVIKALENPVKNYKVLQETSIYLLSNSMTYRRLINNFSNMVNFDFMLKPTLALINKTKHNTSMKNYYDSANLVESINPKNNFRWMNQVLWEVGELYLYKVKLGKSNIVYKRMPEDLCRISSVIDNSICLYSIDLQTISSSSDIMSTMPDEIQKLCGKFKNKTISKDLLVDNRWYELTENAIALNAIDSFLPKGYPLLAPLFPSILALEEQNRKITTDSEIDNLKIIHMQYEVDEEGNSIIDPTVITQFHESVKKNLPDGACVATNPLKMNVYTTKNTQQVTNYRKETNDIVFNSVGSSKELFNGERSSNNAIDASIKSDEILAFTIARIFENYINYELAQDKKTSYWKSKLLPITRYNESEYRKQCETSLTMSKNSNILRYLASCGYTPLESMGLLQIENELDIGKLFIPAATGYNSNSSESSDTGRPSKESEGEVAENEGE